MDLTPEQLVGEDDPIGLLEPVVALDGVVRGKQTWRYRFRLQDYDLGRGEVCDPAQSRHAGRQPSPWAVGAVVAIDPAARGSDLKPPVDKPHPRAPPPDDCPPGALYDLGAWVADQDPGAGPARATEPALSACRRGSVSGWTTTCADPMNQRPGSRGPRPPRAPPSNKFDARESKRPARARPFLPARE